MRPLFALLLSLTLSPALFAAEQIATVLQPSALYAEPYSDARKLTTLKAKQQVTVLKRKGGWYQVQGGGNTGWLRMSRVRFGAGVVERSGEGLEQTLRFLSTGRSGADGVTVATGIRGLEAADVANATPDHQAVARLERFRSSAESARRYAAGAKLKTQPLGYLKQK